MFVAIPAGETYGFFDRPNAFNIVHDLFPIFSQSKISSFADMISSITLIAIGMRRWPHDEKKDVDWNRKRRPPVSGGALLLVVSAATAAGDGSTGYCFVQKINDPGKPRYWLTEDMASTRIGRRRKCLVVTIGN